MSWRATAWAKEQRTGSPTGKAVLLCLADYSNPKTGQCNPRQEDLARDAEISVRTLRTTLVLLEGLNLLRRHKFPGTDQPDQYELLVDGGPANFAGGVRQPVAGGDRQTVAGPYKESEPQLEPQKESPLDPPGGREPGLFEPDPKRKRATSIPPGFGDTGVGPGVRFVDLYADAQQAGLDGMALVASELQKFRDRHTAKGSTFKDWRAAWRYWCRNAVEFSKRDGRKPRRDAGVMEQGAMTYEQMVAKGMTQEDMKRVVGNKGYVP